MVVVWDRSRASKGLAKDWDARLVAFCWAHGRRDGLKAARRWPERERWLCPWGAEIRARSRRKQARREPWEETGPRAQQPWAFPEGHQALATKRRQRHAWYEAHLQAPALPLAKAKVLSSLHNHWAGLTGF